MRIEKHLKKLQQYWLIKLINWFWQTNYLFATNKKYRKDWYLNYRIGIVESECKYQIQQEEILQGLKNLVNMYSQLYLIFNNYL